MKKIILALICFMCSINLVYAKESDNTLSKNAKSAIIMEVSTGEILYEFNAHEKLAPASMTKMMSLLLIMEAIENNVINYTDKVTVSKNASDMGGSQILLETGETMSVDDLLKGVAVASGNDAVVALAEKIAGSEDNFVKMMNEKAKKLGLKNTVFKNCHGLDAEGHVSSAYDMAIIGRELVRHKKILEYSSIYETYLRKGTDRQTWLVNTNKLVRFKSGVDGLKTGYTKDSGYCLTATMMKDNMRVIAVAMGEPSSSTRNDEVSGMLDYAFSQYSINTLFSKDDKIDTIKLDKYNKKYIDIKPSIDVNMLQKKTDGKSEYTHEIKYNNIKGDITTKDKIGTLIIKKDNEVVKEVDLTVSEDIKKLSFIELLVRYLLDGIRGDIKL